MKKTFLMLVAFFAFMSISAQNKAEKNLPEVDVPSLPEVDVYADYPMKQMDIGELAEVAGSRLTFL